MAPPTFLRSFASMNYAKSHEWLRVEDDGTATMGISDFAQGQLGEIVYCDLPTEGATFDTKEAICVLESVKAVGQVYAPGKCEVIAANEQLSEQPDLVNTSPEKDGWLLKVKISDEDPELMDAAAYAKHVETEG